MEIEQRTWTIDQAWRLQTSSLQGAADLVLLFGDTTLLKEPSRIAEIRRLYPGAHLFGCSTAGEIQANQVLDDSLVTTAIRFKSSRLHSACVQLNSLNSSFDVGLQLAQQLPHEGLVHVLVFSVGINVNGSDLVRGLSEGLPPHVTITGGLAGDKARFQETLVISGDQVSNHLVASVGLYGPHLSVRAASLGGWDPFGPERLVTKSKGNILYELDGKSALQLYKTYLGEHSKELPSSALLFPLCLRSDHSEGGIVRTILGIDEANQSMIFAGDVPEGVYGRFMRANFDRLIEGAVNAAKKSAHPHSTTSPDLALLISCIGRKLVLKQRVEEEVEGVREVLGEKTLTTGFYSYGEISPFTPSAKCELHNQTMTITTLTELSDDETVS